MQNFRVTASLTLSLLMSALSTWVSDASKYPRRNFQTSALTSCSTPLRNTDSLNPVSSFMRPSSSKNDSHSALDSAASDLVTTGRSSKTLGLIGVHVIGNIKV